MTIIVRVLQLQFVSNACPNHLWQERIEKEEEINPNYILNDKIKTYNKHMKGGLRQWNVCPSSRIDKRWAGSRCMSNSNYTIPQPRWHMHETRKIHHVPQTFTP